jgi:uncharacterized membrane protein
MDKLIVARVLHVLGVVLWIGGVAMVTTVLLPVVRDFSTPEVRVEFFECIERIFARQARFITLLTGLSGFYMLHAMHAWEHYANLSFWWLHMMTITWIAFTIMLFILEPMVLKRKLLVAAHKKPERTFAIITRMHWILLTLSLVTIAGAVAGSHGWKF